MTEDKPQAKNGTLSPSAMPLARSTPRSVAARSACTEREIEVERDRGRERESHRHMAQGEPKKDTKHCAA